MAKKSPDDWIDMRLVKYPTSEGTLIRRYARRPLADANSWKQGRLKSSTRYRRSALDAKGNPSVSKVQFVLDDKDGYLRGLMAAGQPTEFFDGREIVHQQLSPEGRASALIPVMLARGWISDAQPLGGRNVMVELADVVSSQYSGFNADKMIGLTITVDEHPVAPKETLGRIYPIYGGEHSDQGATDVNGEPADKGLIPVLDAGDYDIVDPSTPVVMLTPPSNLVGTVVGGAGTSTYYYQVTLTTPAGETRPSNIAVVTNAPSPAEMEASGGTRYIALTWDNPAESVGIANGSWVYGRDFNPPATRLDAGFPYPDLAHGAFNDGAMPFPTPDHADVDVQKPIPPPATSTAPVSQTVWTRFIVAHGCVTIQGAPYASNLADGTVPKRARLDSATENIEWMTAASSGWPYADPFLTINGIRMTVLLMKGPRVEQHRKGQVTIAVNICGYEEVGDGSGLVVDEAFLQVQLIINEFILKNNGTGYRGGDWGPLEEFSNGDALLQTSAFQGAQDITKSWLGTATGYIGAIWITQPISAAEFLAQCAATFGCRFVATRQGQIKPVLINNEGDPADGRALRPFIEIKRLDSDPRLGRNEVLNRVVTSWHWDSDAGDFRMKAQPFEDLDSIAAHSPGADSGDTDRRGVREREVREQPYTNDSLTATDVCLREIARFRRRPEYAPLVLKQLGIGLEIGDLVRWTHPDRVATDFEALTPGIILAHEIDADHDETVVTVMDLATAYGIAADPLGTEAGGSPDADMLGDETDDTAMHLG